VLHLLRFNAGLHNGGFGDSSLEVSRHALTVEARSHAGSAQTGSKSARRSVDVITSEFVDSNLESSAVRPVRGSRRPDSAADRCHAFPELEETFASSAKTDWKGLFDQSARDSAAARPPMRS